MEIFKYQDYRQYIRDSFEKMPKSGRGKMTELAQKLEIQTSVLSLIMSGSRSLSPEKSLITARFLGLSKNETRYFVVLVKLDSTTNPELKIHYQEELNSIREEINPAKQSVGPDRILKFNAQAQFYSSWHYSAVRLLTSTDPGGVSIDSICERFHLDRKEVVRLTHFLLAQKLCHLEKEKLKLGTRSTFVQRDSPFFANHATNWRLKALERIPNLTREEVNFTAPLSLSQKDFGAISSQIYDFIQGLSRTVEKSRAEEIACLNIDFFKVR